VVLKLLADHATSTRIDHRPNLAQQRSYKLITNFGIPITNGSCLLINGSCLLIRGALSIRCGDLVEGVIIEMTVNP
jgi:hypothetical protein